MPGRERAAVSKTFIHQLSESPESVWFSASCCNITVSQPTRSLLNLAECSGERHITRELIKVVSDYILQNLNRITD